MTTTTLNRQQQPELQPISGLNINDPQQIKLKNGIPVYFFDNPSQQAIRFDLIFDAGSALQSKALVASSTVKMLQEGTSRFSAGQIAQKIDYFGAYVDLQASKDTAWISLYGLRKHMHNLFPLLKSMLTEATFGNRSFTHFNNRQRQAFLLNSQKPKHIARKAFNGLVFGYDTAYGQTAELTDFDAVSTDDLKDFYASAYTSNNCTIIASGPIDNNFLLLIEEFFGQPWRVGEKPEMLKHDFTFHAGYFPLQREAALQSSIVMGMPFIARTHPDYLPFLLVNTLFGGYFGSRLMTNIREDKGYTYGIYSQVMPLRHASTFSISTETGTAVTKAAIDEIKKEMQRLCDIPVDEYELNLVKNYLNGSYLRALDGVYNMADRFKSALENNLKMSYYVESLDRIQQVTVDEVQILANKYLHPEKMATVVVGDLQNF